MAVEAIQGDQIAAELTQRLELRLNHITQWKTQLPERSAAVFGGGEPKEPPIYVKLLDANIGELKLEGDFLEGALTKSRLLNAKR